MKYLKIQNKGLLDVRLISLMGGTTKTNDNFKIGRFGSGLKYSLAWLVRNNIDFKIFIGEKEIKVSTQAENINGTSFDVIYIDGVRTSISASTGADWKGWMVCREIYCNAIDEGVFTKEITDALIGETGCTTFYLQIAGEIKSTVDSWQHYFLRDIAPIYETKEFAVYPPQNNFAIYKQGVLIHENKDKKAVFSYDVRDAKINELREYKGTMGYDLFNIIRQLDKKTAELFLNAFQRTDVEYYEEEFDYDWHAEFEGSWKEALGQAKIIAKEDLATLKAKGAKFDEEKLVIVPTTMFKKLSTRFHGISAVRTADKVSAFYETFDSETQLAISKGLIILEECGYNMPSELKFIYGVFGDKEVFARINTDEKIIMVSEELKHKSTFALVAMIIEECEHYRTGLQDETRAFQQHFINLYTKSLLKEAKIEL